MGSELVSDSLPLYRGESNNDSTPVSYTEIIYKHLPFYLSIGMTFDQYMNDDCCLVKYYRKAHELKRQQKNQELWWQGLYFYKALCDVSPVLHAFAKKGTKPAPYPSEPYPISLKEIEERKERDEKNRFTKSFAKMLSWAKQINSKRKGEKTNG